MLALNIVNMNKRAEQLRLNNVLNMFPDISPQYMKKHF